MQNPMHDDSGDAVMSLLPNLKGYDNMQRENNFFNKKIIPYFEIQYQQEDKKLW